MHQLRERALQHFFLQCIFVAEESLHQQEGIDWTKVPFPDNSPLLELLSRPPAAIFPMLDSVSRTPRATDDTFVTQLFQVHHSHAALRRPPAGGGNRRATRAPRARAAPLAAGAGFVLRHYAGDVLYTAAGFAHKNTERLSLELEAAAYTPPDSAARAVLSTTSPSPASPPPSARTSPAPPPPPPPTSDGAASGARRRARRRRRRRRGGFIGKSPAAPARGGRASAAAVRRR